jgi:hypothetical protein
LKTRNENRIAHDRGLTARSQEEREDEGKQSRRCLYRWRHTV